MKAIFGLGNPGRKYKKTRHNIGFMVVSSLGDDMEIPIKKRKFNAKIGIGEIAGRRQDKRGHGERDVRGGFEDGRVLLALPQTYMNRSGYSISSILDYYRLSPKDIIVVLDDIDLDFGRIRIRPGGGSGGHRGMKSIIDELDTNDFIRVRIGIGRGEHEDTAQFVLGRFRSGEEAHLDDVIERAKKALLSILHDGVDLAMNRFNE
jgi:PTH1 family peptidyl-tRNA hydrolase